MPIGKITEKYDYARLKLVDGSYQVKKPERIIGHCNYRLHRGYVTASIIKSTEPEAAETIDMMLHRIGISI